MDALKVRFSTKPALWVALVFILAGAFLLAGKAGAHNYYPDIVWDDDNVTPKTANVDTSYAAPIRGAAHDYNTNTDLTVEHCDWPCSANIEHRSVRGRTKEWSARARRNANPVTEGTVEWNSRVRNSAFTAHRLARHEMGHIFGLDHVECGGGPREPDIKSIMGCPEDGKKILHAHDISDMNKKY